MGAVRPRGRGVAKILVSGSPLNTTPPTSASPPRSSPAEIPPAANAESTALAVD